MRRNSVRVYTGGMPDAGALELFYEHGHDNGRGNLLGVQPQVAKSLFRFDAASGLLSSQLGRHSTPLEDAAAPRLEPSLIAQAQTLSSAATETMPLAEVSRELERLALQPDVAAQPDLVASLSSAQPHLLSIS